MIRAFALALALAALAAPAAAQAPLQSVTRVAAAASVPKLRPAVTVSADVVRIGDLIDNAGAVADEPVFRSPDAGTTGTVAVQQVLNAIRPYHIYLIDTADLTEVEVTRAGRTIDVATVEARIAATFAGHYGLGEAKNLRVTLDGLVRPVTIEASATSDLGMINASFDKRTGRFDITFEVPGSQAARRMPLRLTGTLIETVATVVLTHTLARGEVIKVNDVTVERRPSGEIAEPITSVGEAIGLTLRQPLRGGQALRRADLMKPELVHRDDNVTLVYEVPGLLLTTRGKALEGGAEGDIVNVANLQTKRTIQGIVSGPNRVTIAATAVRTSTETAAAAAAGPMASR